MVKVVVQLARHGRVISKEEWLVSNAGLKRKAALVVAALLGVPDSIPRVIMAVIGSYL